MAKRLFSMAVLSVVVLVVIAACGSPQDDGPHPTVTRIASPINAPVLSPTPEPGAEPTEAPAEATSAPDATSEGGAAAETQTVTVLAHDIYFDPAEITIQAGKVLFDVTNQGAAPHDFTIDALGIHIVVDPGATQTLEVDVPAGTYEYYCSVPGHKAAGMVGTLVVN
jgi:plastocyanin